MDLKKWKLFRELDPSLASACKFAKIVDSPEVSVGFLVLQNDDVYAVTGFADNFMCLGNGYNADAVVNQASKVESLCGKAIIDFYGNVASFAALTEDGCVYSWASTKSTKLRELLCTEDSHPGVDGIPRKILFPDANTTKVRQVSYGDLHALCLSSDGEVFGWNTNAFGQLGSESAGKFACNAVKVAGFNDRIVQVVAGTCTSYALDSLGKVWSWGSWTGSLGYQASANQRTPRLIENLPKIIKIAVGADHVLALSEMGQVYFWGKFEFFCSVPLVKLPTVISVDGMEPVIDIGSTPSAWFAAVQNKNRVYLWGKWYGSDISTPMATELASVEDVFACAISPIMLQPIRTKIQPQGVVGAWKRAFNDPSTADVLFSVDGEVLHAHSVFLKLRSDYFRRMFDGVWEESRRESGAIEIHGFSFRIFRAFMYFIYNESLIEPDMSVDDLTELMQAADFYGEGGLHLDCQRKLRTKLTLENACFIYTCAVRSNAENLQKYAVEFMVPVYKQVVESAAYAEMDNDLKTKLMIHFADLGVIQVPKRRRT